VISLVNLEVAITNVQSCSYRSSKISRGELTSELSGELAVMVRWITDLIGNSGTELHLLEFQ
jgi:hypothetical protein